MTLTQLKYLVAVAETRHFAAAAERCGVTQPTLSMQLQKLERSLGLTILDRRKKPIEPTEIGAALIAQARRVLHEGGRFEALVQEARGTMTGELRLGIIPTLAPYLLPLVVPTFAQRYPGIRLRIREQITGQIVGELLSGRLDAGLASDHEPSASISSTLLFGEHLLAFVAPEHRLAAQRRIAVSALQPGDLWLLSEGHCFRDQMLRLCQEGEPDSAQRSLHFESGSLETLVRLVKQNGGMTLLPYLATIDLSETDKRTYLRALVPPPQRAVRLLLRHDYHRGKLLGAFVAVVREVLPEQLKRSVQAQSLIVNTLPPEGGSIG
jgi:LysR family hydrogen peroxide-inducible transcriptional activator